MTESLWPENAAENDTLLPQNGDGAGLEPRDKNTDFTTTKEIAGWCLYSWACEPFVVSCIGTYVPLLLEQLARDNGVKLVDHSVPCKAVLRVPDPVPPTQPSPIEKNGKKCVLPLFNGSVYIDTSSFALYTFAFSVFVQTLVVICVTGASDKGEFRKRILIGTSLVGGVLTMCFLLLQEHNYYLAAVLLVLGNCAFGIVNVCGNAFLPILVAHHPKLAGGNIGTPRARAAAKGQVSAKISGSGAAAGYVSALLVQMATMLMIVRAKKRSPSTTDDSTWPIQVAIFFVGLWWCVFQVPVAVLLKSRPGQPQLHVTPIAHLRWGNSPQLLYIANLVNVVWQYVRYGWHQLAVSFRQASQLKDIVLFLVSWFIISDSLTTINSTAVLFARAELHMTTSQLSVIGTLTMVSAIAGAYVIPNVVQPYLGVSLKTLLQLIVIWASLIPFYGLLGFFFDSFGLKHSSEMFFLAVWYGFSLGGIATVSRSLFSLLIPKGSESMYFALFQITDKGSSILGPVLVALITDKTHDIRNCFWFLFAVLLVSLPVVQLLDLERGNEEAKLLSVVEEE